MVRRQTGRQLCVLHLGFFQSGDGGVGGRRLSIGQGTPCKRRLPDADRVGIGSLRSSCLQGVVSQLPEVTRSGVPGQSGLVCLSMTRWKPSKQFGAKLL